MGLVLIKLGENVGTLVRLIVLLHKNRFSVDEIMMSITFFYLFLGEATMLKRKQLCAKGNNYAAPDCDTSEINLCFFVDLNLIELDTYMQPNIRLINPISKRFTSMSCLPRQSRAWT